ncbi:MAG: hypothetical protein JSW38_01870 [Dehalococcoidia bacterium]|nr:MAG: hypothetical protein JSW38_01870 [Dehalococcoidia bacterium]
MRKRLAILAVSLLIIGCLVGGSVTAAIVWDQDKVPEEALSVAELLDNPVYNKPITIQGEVTLLGELLCPCFVLVSGGETIQVWYDLMVDDDGTEKPPVSVEGLENGDWLYITGELKQAGQHTSLNDFWAISIEKGETQIVGGTPGSCGYVWDAERDGWHRPWDPDSFIPAEDKPEWDKFIPSPAALSVAELLNNPLYDTEVTIYGTVSLLGEVRCPCFELTSGGETLIVWYNLMVEDDGTQRPPVSVEGIENGDRIIITGELRPTEGQLPSRTFWASDIKRSGPVEPEMVKVQAPIDDMDIWIAESWPPQYFLHVVSGLPNSCVKYDSYNVIRQGDTIRVEVFNLEPADGGMGCDQVYELVENTIPLGSDFISGKTYTVVVNNTSQMFTAQ